MMWEWVYEVSKVLFVNITVSVNNSRAFVAFFSFLC